MALTALDVILPSGNGGYLGAGKTTLLNQLLRHNAGRQLAVLVNGFRNINIDDALISSRATAADVGSISGRIDLVARPVFRDDDPRILLRVQTTP